MNDQTNFNFFINKEEYKDKHDIKIGRPAQGEISTLSFFPKLSVGYKHNKSVYKLEKNNEVDKFAIDYSIDKWMEEKLIEQGIGWIDTETRAGDFPWSEKGKDEPLNILVHSHASNYGETKPKIISGKVRWFKSHPKNSFHLALRYTREEGLCVWAEDFIHLKPKWQKNKDFAEGGDYAYKATRRKVISGKINKDNIEDFIIQTLIEGGFIK